MDSAVPTFVLLVGAANPNHALSLGKQKYVFLYTDTMYKKRSVNMLILVI
jgi:hypothetical protein